MALVTLQAAGANYGHVAKVGSVYTRTTADPRQLFRNAATGDQRRIFAYFSIGSIPGGSTITGITARFVIDLVRAGGNFIGSVIQSAIGASDQAIYDGVGDDTFSPVFFSGPGGPFEQALSTGGADPVADLQAAINAARSWWAIGLKYDFSATGAMDMDFLPDDPMEIDVTYNPPAGPANRGRLALLGVGP